MNNAIEQAVSKAVIRSGVYSGTGAGIVTRWIAGALSSPQGRFIVHSATRCRFTAKMVNCQAHQMRFTARVRVSVAPDFEGETEKRFIWTFRKNGSWKANIS